MVLFILTCGSAAGQADPRETRGDTTQWTGTLEVNGMKMKLDLSLAKEDENWSGTLVSVNQGKAEIELADIVWNERKRSFRMPAIGAAFEGVVKDDSIDGVWKQGGVELPLTFVANDKHDSESKDDEAESVIERWKGALKIGAVDAVMQFRVVRSDDDSRPNVFFDSVSEGRTGFEATMTMEDDRLVFDVPAIKLSYRGTLNADRTEADGTWSQGGRELPLKLKRRTEAEPEDTPNRPQYPKEPLPYDSEEVTFENTADDVSLSGTLTLPRTSGPHPAVVLISGSGQQDRDESWMGHKPFLVLADHLTRKGIAVLRFDDRGIGKSTGDYLNATTEDLSRDTEAAFDFLKADHRIETDAIGLIGHSEGGLIGPMVAQRNDDVAFVVLLAGTGVPGREISLSQSEILAKSLNLPDDAIALQQTLNKNLLDAVITHELGEDLDEAINVVVDEFVATLPEQEQDVAGETVRKTVASQKPTLNRKWMKYFLAYDPAVTLSNLNCPILALQGLKDTQVIAGLNLPAIRAALKNNRHSISSVIEFPEMNHLFQRCETGMMNEYSKIEETIDEEVLEEVSNWIGKALSETSKK
ncbi:MAG: alpha/beta hydrolase [Pirellulaceae bacterium]